MYCRNVCDGNSGAMEREKAEEELFGQGESRYQGEKTVGEGSVGGLPTTGLEANAIAYIDPT